MCADEPLHIPSQSEPSLQRLQKYLARAGVASRRGSEELIEAGRITVNGVVVTQLGTKVDALIDVVCVDGRPVVQADEQTYLILNKPAGYLTTMDDPQGRPTVALLAPVDRYPGLFPVGRLDCDTTGLLLFTTDGELAARLLHPRYHVEKCYEVLVEGRLFEQEANILRRGIVLDDGPCAPADVHIVVAGATSRVRCTIHEGRKRQIKRMFAAIGHPVLTLHRSLFGPLALDGVAQGEWRLLEPDEVRALREASARDCPDAGCSREAWDE